MKLLNEKGQAVYYNVVEKRGNIRCIVLAASGQKLIGRDKEKVKSRTFLTEVKAQAWLERNGYTIRPQ